MPPISFWVIFPVPISMPLYICLESAEIISAPFQSKADPLRADFFAVCPEPSRRAIFTHKSDFPEAVGPRMTIIFCFGFDNLDIQLVVLYIIYILMPRMKSNITDKRCFAKFF